MAGLVSVENALSAGTLDFVDWLKCSWVLKLTTLLTLIIFVGLVYFVFGDVGGWLLTVLSVFFLMVFLGCQGGRA